MPTTAARPRPTTPTAAHEAGVDGGATSHDPARDDAAIRERNERVIANQGLVHSIARNYRDRGADLEDCVQWGNLGLMRAAEKFEPGRGFRFSTYASFWIRQAIGRGLDCEVRPILVPLHVRTLAKRYLRVEHVLASAAPPDAPPSPDDVLDAMGVPAPRRGPVRRAVAVFRLDYMGGDSHGLNSSPAPDPGETEAEAEDRARSAADLVARMLGTLDERSRHLLVRHHGLDGGRPETLAGLARQLGVSKERARQVHDAALARLRELFGPDPDL